MVESSYLFNSKYIKIDALYNVHCYRWTIFGVKKYATFAKGGVSVNMYYSDAPLYTLLGRFSLQDADGNWSDFCRILAIPRLDSARVDDIKANPTASYEGRSGLATTRIYFQNRYQEFCFEECVFVYPYSAIKSVVQNDDTAAMKYIRTITEVEMLIYGFAGY